MGEGRAHLPQPFTADGPFLLAILDRLDDIHALLADRLPVPNGGEPVEVQEPAPPAGPPGAVPVSEPAPVGPPAGGEDAEPVEVEEEDPEPARPEPPRRAGAGSGRTAWAEYAQRVGVEYPDRASRDEIIAACVAAGVIDAN